MAVTYKELMALPGPDWSRLWAQIERQNAFLKRLQARGSRA